MSQASNDFTTLLASSRRYTKSGIGGAGNIRKSSSTLTVSSTSLVIPIPTKGVFSTGIGGAGNSRSYEERASISSSSDALARNSFRKQSVVGSYHHGIGGVGNRSSFADSSTSSAVSSNNSFSSAVGTQSGADRVKGGVASFFGSASLSSKRHSTRMMKSLWMLVLAGGRRMEC